MLNKNLAGVAALVLTLAVSCHGNTIPLEQLKILLLGGGHTGLGFLEANENAMMQVYKSSALPKLQQVYTHYRLYYRLPLNENLPTNRTEICAANFNDLTEEQWYSGVTLLYCRLVNSVHLIVSASSQTGLLLRLSSDIHNMACLLSSSCSSGCPPAGTQGARSGSAAGSGDSSHVLYAYSDILLPLNSMLRCL